MCLVVAVAATIAGCAQQPKRHLADIPAAYTGPYRLDSGDQVRVTVFGQADLTRVYPVDVSGNITMPLIGAVPARGRTPVALSAGIAGRLAKNYVRNPDVSVEVQTYRPFFVLGEVQRAGQFPYVSGMTVQTAIAIAGGYTYRADQRGVTITRQGQNKPIRGYAPNDVAIMPGDTIYVDERYF
ncbi:Capsule polysaccharide export protein [hydrothermal vent metagenome]|uniref:Capsule polysaccharide export protein n=1 Tax=hydrothermal vent metagenome TaxID=652676 RepID=A0A3B0TM91_9ZZZZ